jgi:hypothetical protein
VVERGSVVDDEVFEEEALGGVVLVYQEKEAEERDS